MTTPPPGSMPPGSMPPPWAPQPAPGAPPVVSTPRLRGRVQLWLSLILGVVGIALVVVGAVLLYDNSISKIDGFERVPITQSTTHSTVHLSRTGDYVAYFETPKGGPTRYSLDVGILDPSGARVAVHRYDGNVNLTYNDRGRHGKAIYSFTIHAAGDYLVVVRSQVPAQGTDLALGESIAHGLVVGGVMVGVGILLVVAAIVLLIVGLVRRSRHRNELQRGFGVGGYPTLPPGPTFSTQGGYPGPPPGQGYPPR